MQITDKLRNEVTSSLHKLGYEEAGKIALKCNCSRDTVYREWRKIRGVAPGKVLFDNPVVVCLIELAAKRKKKANILEKRILKSATQLAGNDEKGI